MNVHLKPSCFFAFTCFLSFTGHAQSGNDSFQRSVYLFDHFVSGTVLLKSGAAEQAPLNYNAAKQGIAFEKNGRYFDLTGLETIDTVYVENKKFIPVNAVFYEVVAAPVELYATYTCKAQPIAATTEHAGSVRRENSQVSNTVSDVYVTRQYRGDYAMAFRKQYWLKRYRDFFKVNTEKQIIRVFPKKEEAIRAFVRENNTNFERETDLLKLLSFCTNNL